MIKGDGVAVGLTEDASDLRRWMVSGPEISRLIEQFEYDNRVKADFLHQEETEANQTSFLTNVKQMIRTLDELGSPFMEETIYLILLESKEIVDIKVSESHGHLVKLGMEQYERFAKVKSDRTASFYDLLRRNKLPLFNRKPSTEVSTSKTKLLSIKDDRHLFLHLFISCQSRRCDLNEFFMHENHMIDQVLQNKLMKPDEICLHGNDAPISVSSSRTHQKSSIPSRTCFASTFDTRAKIWQHH